jgi:ABC-type dipeptide/oligopeptide/nickel transport system ATPase component
VPLGGLGLTEAGDDPEIPPMTPIVELHAVIKDYPLGHRFVRALDGVDVSFRRGEFVTVAGPSGSGKTTLLNLVGCVDVPTEGEVVLDGHAVTRLSERALTRLRLEKLGFIFQSFNLIPVLDVVQNVEFPLLLQARLSRADRRRGSKRSSSGSGSVHSGASGPTSCPAVSGSALPSPARWSRAPRSSSPMSRRPTSTRTRASRSSSS